MNVPTPHRYDPLATLDGDAGPSTRRAAFGLIAAIAAHAVIVGGAWWAQQGAEEPTEQRDELVFIEVIEPEPAPVPEPEPAPVEEPAPEPEPLVVPEPEPVVAPDPTPAPEPVREERRAPEPAPEPEPTPAEPPPPQDTRPVRIGLEGQSFAQGGAGPTFARGDRASGGRPDRTSVDPADGRAAGDQAPTEAAAEPVSDSTSVRPSRGRPPRDRSPQLASGVRRNPSDYPRQARDEDIEADCTAVFEVDASGAVGTIRSISCTESDYGFEEVARAHIEREFRFQPAIRGGEPQPEQVRWQFQFRIDD